MSSDEAPKKSIKADMSLSVIPDISLRIALFEGEHLVPFKVVGPRAVLRSMKEELGRDTLSGVISPHCPITLDEDERLDAGIPDGATSFAFSYPVEDLRGQFEWLLPFARDSPWLFYLLIGGFAYFDKHGDVIQLNALSLSPAAAVLHLIGPYKAAEKAIEFLEASERLQPIALKDLVDAGFRSFCWVHPGEAPGGTPLSTTSAYNDGAFCYVTSGGPVFFSLSMDGKEETVTEELRGAQNGMNSAMAQMHKMWDDNERLLRRAEKLTMNAAERDPRAKARARRQRYVRILAPLLITTVIACAMLSLAFFDELAFRLLGALLREGLITYITWTPLRACSTHGLSEIARRRLSRTALTIPPTVVATQFGLCWAFDEGVGLGSTSGAAASTVLNFLLLPSLIFYERCVSRGGI